MVAIDITQELEKISHILSLISKGLFDELSETDELSQLWTPLPESENSKIINQIYENISSIYEKINELNIYSSALAKGDLDIDFPPRKNFMAGGLKELHANLLHLTWKVNQIAAGDYNQTVDFMGKFSQAFNDMVDKLKNRDILLSESRNLVEVLFKHTNIIVFVVDAKTGDLIYGKGKDYNIYYDSSFSDDFSDIAEKLKQKSVSTNKRMYDWDLFSETDNKWYTVKSMMMTWTANQEVYFHMLFDISEQKVIQERLELAVSTDVKTGAYSGAYAMEEIDSLIKSGGYFCISYFDLDGLKIVNDTLGHSYGDELLKTFVNIAIACIRPSDSMCRLGGDEFLLIAPGANKEATQKIITRIETKAKEINDSKEYKFKISFSYGIEYCDGAKDLTPQSIIDVADKKMYEQKRLKKFKGLIKSR